MAKDRTIAQLRRPEWEPQGHVFPDWLKLIPASSYTEYLKATAPYENFLMGHPGTYEHSIIDMAARGIRTIVPVLNGNTFGPKDTVDRLSLDTFSTKDGFFNILNSPLTGDHRIDLCSDACDIVKQIDTHCQSLL